MAEMTWQNSNKETAEPNNNDNITTLQQIHATN